MTMAFLHTRSRIALLAVCCLLVTVRTEDNAVDNLLAGLHSNDQWGIADRAVPVGKLFQMKLPAANTHTVREVGRSELPSWLQLEQNSAGTTLSGVPSETQAGQQFYLEVIPSDDQPSSDVFSIKVVQEPVVGATKVEDAGAVQCDIDSSVTVAGVLLDASLEQLGASERVALLRDVGRHLNMPATLLRLAKPANKALFDSSALVAGAGNVKSAVGPALHVEWQVGCGNVHAHHMPILQNLEASASDGRMAHAIGHGVVGWHVSNKKPVTPHRIKRYARNIHPTPTVPSIGGVPTKPPISKIDLDKSKSYKPTHSPTKKITKSDDKIGIRPSKPIEATRTITAVRPSEMQPSRPSERVPESRTATPTLHPSIEPSHPGHVISPTDLLPSSTHRTPKPTKFTPIPPIVVATTTESFNYPPVVKHEIKPIIVPVGDILHYKIHKNTFYDPEDGNSRKLKLELLNKEGLDLSPNLWLRFNAEKQVLYGMPWTADIGKQEYYMVAVDSDNKMVRELFTISVVRRTDQNEVNHEFSVGLALDYDEFMRNVEQRLDVAKKIAHVYGDHNARHMSILRMEAGSVQYAWTNTSLSGSECPANEINHLLSFLVTQNNTLNETMVEKMKPYRVLRAGAAPLGSCSQDEVPLVTSQPATPVKVPDRRDDDNVMITTVLPAIIIAVVLLLAGIIACFLYRKKRNGKLSDEDKETYHSKGTPVIFEDELDDNSEPSSKPLISKDEKPPLSPPDYQQRDDSGTSTPDSLRKQKLDTTGEDEDDLLAYQRPPPVTGSLDSHGETRPLTQPACRQPPPYVAP